MEESGFSRTTILARPLLADQRVRYRQACIEISHTLASLVPNPIRISESPAQRGMSR